MYQQQQFEHVISLGGSCGVAMAIEQAGMRDGAYPFDWVMSSWTSVEQSLRYGFDDWFVIDDMYQSIDQAEVYRNRKYEIRFFHDFNGYESLDKQIAHVQEKYQRRVSRFHKSIQEPCLFIRKIASFKSDEDLKYMENHWQDIKAMLKSYNPANELLLIIYKEQLKTITNEDILSNAFCVAAADESVSAIVSCGNDKVSLIDYLHDLNYAGDRDSNMLFFQKKQEKKKLKFVDAFFRKIRNLLNKDYRHHQRYRGTDFFVD